MLPARIVFLGGSTVHGEGDPEHGGFVSHFKAWHETAKPAKHRVFNLGVGGDTVADMLSRGPSECQARRPNLVVLYPGLNDSRRRGSVSEAPATSLDQFTTTLHTLIKALGGISPTLVMSSVPPDESRTNPFRGGYFFSESDAYEITRAIASICSSPETYYFPLFERWCNQQDRKDLLLDGLHCNAQGHRELFKELRLFLTEKFEVNAT